MPVMIFITVLLPAPFGPIRLTISPAPIANERSCTACRPPKFFVTLVSSSMILQDLHHFYSWLAKQPVRPVGHQQHQDGAQEQQPRHAGLGGQARLPDERQQ